MISKVIDDVRKQMKNFKKLGRNDSELDARLDKWIDRVDNACDKAATLKAEAEAQPGEAFGSV